MKFKNLCVLWLACLLLSVVPGCGGDDDDDTAGGDDDTAGDDDDCACLRKDNIYKVTGPSDLTSSAACADDNDVLLSGGCSWEEQSMPYNPISLPEFNDDPTQPAQWYCSTNTGEVVAEAFCVTVN